MFSKNTLDNLEKLAKIIITNKGGELIIDPAHPLWIKQAEIPGNINSQTSEKMFLTLTGEDFLQYSRCLSLLEDEPSLEALSIDEIDKDLWLLVCDVFVQSEHFRKPNAVKDSITTLQARLARPIEDFEVMIPINNIKFGSYVHVIGGVKFIDLTDEIAVEWGIKTDKTFHNIFYKAAVGKTVAISIEKGADPWKAAERARQSVATALNILRVELLIDHEPQIIGWKIHDEQMLAQQSEHIVVRKANDKSQVLPGWNRGFESIEFSLNEVISKQIERSSEIMEFLFNKTYFNLEIVDRFKRALEWIGKSVLRDEPDDKIVDICTSLETILTTKSDLRKGECITLRSVILNMKLGKPYYSPQYIMDLYLKRSDIIHGSKRKICTVSDYEIGRVITLDVICKSIEYAKINSFKKHSSFIQSLDADDALINKAPDFCKISPNYYKDILEASKRIIEQKVGISE